VKLNISHIRLLKFLATQEMPVRIKDCENFLMGTLVSLSSSRKYIHYLKMKKLINIEQSRVDKRIKLVSINESTRNKIDSFL